jgi:hypothetical protein
MPRATDNPTTRRPHLVVVTDAMVARSAACMAAGMAAEDQPSALLQELRALTRIYTARRVARAQPSRRTLRTASVVTLADYRGARA